MNQFLMPQNRCSEKALLLQKFEYAEDAGAEAFRKDIAIMESGLKRLEAQEQNTLLN